METETQRAAKVAKQNDEFRRGYSFSITRGIQALPDIPEVVKKVQSFSNFNEDNDPYGEHDFGLIKCFGKKIFWKIDYYDPSLTMWCDPLHPECERVLTIMLAEEY